MLCKICGNVMGKKDGVITRDGKTVCEECDENIRKYSGKSASDMKFEDCMSYYKDGESENDAKASWIRIMKIIAYVVFAGGTIAAIVMLVITKNAAWFAGLFGGGIAFFIETMFMVEIAKYIKSNCENTNEIRKYLRTISEKKQNNKD